MDLRVHVGMCVQACVHVCVRACARLAYQKVYGSACADYFLQSCLPAVGVSANFFFF